MSGIQKRKQKADINQDALDLINYMSDEIAKMLKSLWIISKLRTLSIMFVY